MEGVEEKDNLGEMAEEMEQEQEEGDKMGEKG